MEGELGVWEDDDWDSGEGVDKGMKSRFLVRSPDERYIFFGQGKQRSYDVRVVLDKCYALQRTRPGRSLTSFSILTT